MLDYNINLINNSLSANLANTTKYLLDQISQLNTTTNQELSLIKDRITNLEKEQQSVENELYYLKGEKILFFKKYINFFLTKNILVLPCSLQCQNHGIPNDNCTSCTNCANGWSGMLCDIPSTSCNLSCAHDGYPNANCTSCICMDLYTGVQCEEWSNLPPEAVQEKMYYILEESKNNTSSKSKKDIDSNEQHCSLMTGFLGYGTDLNGNFHHDPIIAPDLSNIYELTDAFNTTRCFPNNFIASVGPRNGGKLYQEDSTVINEMDFQPFYTTHDDNTQVPKIFGIPTNPEEYVYRYDILLHIYRQSYKILKMHFDEIQNQRLSPGYIALRSLLPDVYDPTNPSIKAAFYTFFEVNSTSSLIFLYIFLPFLFML